MMISIILAIILPFLKYVNSHAALLEPPARNVLYRMGFPSAPYHENDDYLVCVETDATTICPPCGDAIDAQYPRPHEAGGKFATGIITRSYVAGQEIDIYVNVTLSHGGYIELKLCPNNDVYHPVDQGCLDLYPLQVAGKKTSRIPVTSPYGGKEEIHTVVKLPEDLICSQCVMQMSFNTDQYLPSRVLFRNCADMEIVSNDLPEVAPSATDVTYNHPPATLRSKEYNHPPATLRSKEYNHPTDPQRNIEHSQTPVEKRNEWYDHPSSTQSDEEYRQLSANQRNEDALSYQRAEDEAQPSGFPQWREQRGHVTPYHSRSPTKNEKFDHRFSLKNY